MALGKRKHQQQEAWVATPGTYFRMILIGYFEGIASQRGIAWRCSDSRSSAKFLSRGPTEETPDHSSLMPAPSHDFPGICAGDDTPWIGVHRVVSTGGQMPRLATENSIRIRGKAT